ncbi:DUF7009 family protein [Negadavirga shengliensis]|uniref:DUF7009 family protein n=1 Tax=Negadavirga shengliensis TaxID=1389218 RepID=A0ABV9T6L4_9BACT
MKLRIHKNSVRLRLSQTEVDRIGKGLPVKESLVLPGGDTNVLSYWLQTDDKAQEIGVQFAENTILVTVPPALASSWAFSDQVGMESNFRIADDHELYLLIEKDFQCLHKRPGEDESDNFPHPEK